jgi:hypothetical protein
MFRRTAGITLAILFTFTGVLNLSAADAPDQETGAPGSAPIAGAIAHAAKDAGPAVTLWTLSQRPKRPGMLPVLYGAYAGLQVMDVVSTRKALASGAQEANPVMQKGGMAATIGIKAASGVATVYVAEKMWKRHRVGAIVLMAAMNGVSAAVVARNNRNASQR